MNTNTKPIDEPIPGLPEPLPEGESILWQGAPNFMTLAASAFHTRLVGGYFLVILALRMFNAWDASHSAAHSLIAGLWLLPLALLALSVLYAMAWLTARTTVYTVTTRRVVMHIGVVLDLTLNLPFEALESVDLRVDKHAHGDLPMRIMASNKIAYTHLWPHARPWRLKQPQPMMRAVPNAQEVGAILAKAMREVVEGGPLVTTRGVLKPRGVAVAAAHSGASTANEICYE